MQISSHHAASDSFFLQQRLSYLPVAPQLVALHAVAVVQGDGAAVGDGVEADFFRVHGVAHADVLPPAEREHLQGNKCLSFLVKNLCRSYAIFKS